MVQKLQLNESDVISRASTLVSPSDKIEFMKELDRSLVTDRDVTSICLDLIAFTLFVV